MHSTVEQYTRGTSRIIAGFICFAIALFLAGNALLSLRAATDLLEIRDRIARTHEIIEELQNVDALIKDADIEARGYTLTGQTEFLEMHRVAVARTQSRMRVLLSLIHI